MSDEQRGLIMVVVTLALFWYLGPRIPGSIPSVEMPGKTPQYETWST